MLPILPLPPTASSLPSGEKASERMPPIECRRWTGSQVYSSGASSVARARPDSTSQTTMWPTLSPVARRRPSGEIAQAKSIEGKWVGVSSSWPRSSWIKRPVSTSQSRQTMSSADAGDDGCRRAWPPRRGSTCAWASTSRTCEPRLDVPPDQPAVVAARDQRRAGQREARHVAVVPAELFAARAWPGRGRPRRPGSRSRRRKPGSCRGFARKREDDLGARELLDRLELFGVCGGHRSGPRDQASTSRIGSVPGSVSGTGRAPTMYSSDDRCRAPGRWWRRARRRRPRRRRRPGRSRRSCRRPSRPGCRRRRAWRSRRRRSGRGPGSR